MRAAARPADGCEPVRVRLTRKSGRGWWRLIWKLSAVTLNRFLLATLPTTVMVATVIFVRASNGGLCSEKTAEAKLMLGRTGPTLPYVLTAGAGAICLFAGHRGHGKFLLISDTDLKGQLTSLDNMSTVMRHRGSARVRLLFVSQPVPSDGGNQMQLLKRIVQAFELSWPKPREGMYYKSEDDDERHLDRPRGCNTCLLPRHRQRGLYGSARKPER